MIYRKMKKSILLMITAFLVMQALKAQHKPIPVTISVFNEATAIPFTKFVTTPVHPGVQVGSGITYKEGKHGHLMQAFNIGYIFHSKLFHGFFINTELGYDYKLHFGVNLKTAVGIGYLLTFSTQQAYQFKNGRFEAGRDKGNSHATLSLATGLGYRLKKKDPHSPEVFMMYQGWAEYPYSPGFIPVMTHANLHLGTKFFIGK